VFQDASEVVKYCTENQVEAVDMKLCDLRGRWHHLTIPGTRLTLEHWERGIGFDASSYGLTTTEHSDMVFVPDPSTAFLDPFLGSSTLSMVADVYTLNNGLVRLESDPRYVAAKAQRYLRETGVADTAVVAPEFEFSLLDDLAYRVTPGHQYVELASAEAGLGETSVTGSGYVIGHQDGYHAAPPYDKTYNLRAQMVSTLEALGCPVKYHHHEVGRAGQLEIEVSRGPLLTMGDRSLLVKYVVRNVAHNNGCAATFLPKPMHGEAGNGMHVHMQLFRDREPVFSDDEGYAGLSEHALSFIAGVLKHAPSLLALTNPSTNSFKRLVPGFEAPVSICFGLANRTSAIRIPAYATRPEDRRFEFRPSDATCNPYLAFAALLMAGLDGIRHNLDPRAEGYGPLDENVFELAETRNPVVDSLPASLSEALDALESDSDYLLHGGVFTKELIARWITDRKEELMRVAQTPHPVEFQLYNSL